MDKNSPAYTYTIEYFISMRLSDEMTFRNFSILEVIDGIEMLDHNLVEDYLTELENMCVPLILDDESYRKYRYAPDLLAFDIYGSTQLDFIVLYANGMVDPKEFNTKKIKLPYASQLKTFLNQVYNSDYNYIRQNRSDNNLLII